MSSNFEDVGRFHERFVLTTASRAGHEFRPNLLDTGCMGVVDSRNGNIIACGKSVAEHAPEPRAINNEAITFRLNFMLEELCEYAEAVGFELATVVDGARVRPQFLLQNDPSPQQLDHAFDGLIDLVYVTLGTAHLHGFPWQEGWKAVQDANMKKVRAQDHAFMANERFGGKHCDKCNLTKNYHSERGSSLDVVKPTGWQAPDIAAVLEKYR